MDTRSKIVAPAKLLTSLATGQWTVVVGLFDPLTACQARRIAAHAALGRKTLVVVLPNELTLLEANARAHLVAALRDVNLVVISSSADIHKLLTGCSNLLFDEDTAAERQRSEDFQKFILDREGQGRASGSERP